VRFLIWSYKKDKLVSSQYKIFQLVPTTFLNQIHIMYKNTTNKITNTEALHSPILNYWALFPSNTTIYQLTHSHITVHNWVYWSYKVATCFGSQSHPQAIHQQSYSIELCVLYGSIYLSRFSLITVICPRMALWAETCSDFVRPINSVVHSDMWVS
jgi:hypothetical protein